jgi:hypothetical protein
VVTASLVGAPAEAIADHSRGEEVWAVVVGAKGHSAVGRVLLGSVADRLVHICNRPVLVVRGRGIDEALAPARSCADESGSGVVWRDQAALTCETCAQSRVVALCCKSRGWCPCCTTRHALDTGVHLESVLPAWRTGSGR